MVTRAMKVRLGVFITIAVSLVIITIGVIVTPKFLEKRDIYYIGYRDISVTGLQQGGSVKYHGLTVGYVNEISIDPEDLRRVIVEVSLKEGTPIKKDTYADIVMLGITGLKLIELRGGSNSSEFLDVNGYINPGRSVTDDITGKAEVIAEKAELILNNIASLTESKNRDKVIKLIDQISMASGELNEILSTNKKPIETIISNSEQMSEDLKDLSESTAISMREVQTLLESDSLSQIIANLSDVSRSLKQADFAILIEHMAETLENTNNVLEEMDMTFTKSRTDIEYSIQSLKESIAYINQFTRMIAEDPSVLVRGAETKGAPDYKLE